jgi:hypothetical protein
MGKNFTKSDKKQKFHKNKSSVESFASLTPSLKTIKFILSYSKTTKSVSNNKFLLSLN